MIRGDMDGLRLTEDGLKQENQKIKNRVVIFGIVSIVVMLVTTYLQVTYLKNFFRFVLHGVPRPSKENMEFVVNEIERIGSFWGKRLKMMSN